MQAVVGRTLDLVVCNAEVAQLAVVLEHTLPQVDDPRLVLVVQVALHKVLAELNDLSKRQALSRCTVQAARGLHDLQSLVVGGAEGNSTQPVVNRRKQLATRLTLLRPALLVRLNHLLAHGDRRAKLDDSTGAELVRVKVRETNGNELDIQTWVLRHRAERHDSKTRLEREKVGAVVRPALGEDTNSPIVVQAIKHCTVCLFLVDMRQDLVGETVFLLHVRADTRRGFNVRRSILGRDGELGRQADLGVGNDFGNSSLGVARRLWQQELRARRSHLGFELCVLADDEQRVVVRQPNPSRTRLCVISSAGHGYGVEQPRDEADKLAFHGLGLDCKEHNPPCWR